MTTQRFCFGLAVLCLVFGCYLLFNGESIASLMVYPLMMFLLIAGAMAGFNDRIIAIERYLRQIKRIEEYLKQHFPPVSDADQSKEGEDENKEDQNRTS